MSQNDKVLLDRLIAERQIRFEHRNDASELFEWFVAEEILKNYDLDDEQIESGLVDGGGDGAIDALYAFVDGALISSADDLEAVKENPVIELIVIQAKRSTGFQEAPIHSLVSTVGDLLDMEKSPDSLASTYNPKLIGIFQEFHLAVQRLAGRFPELKSDSLTDFMK